ncbi:energy transducer TonB [bacterium]|nr:energy transducer TonB [bacterium]
MSVLNRRTKYKSEHSVLLKRSLIVTLIIFILIFNMSKRFSPLHNKQLHFDYADIFLDVPVTDSRGAMPRPPDLPKVPIPVEDDYVPPDETIPDTDFDINKGIPLFDGNTESGIGSGASAPRPVLEVIPSYPEKLRKHGIGGIITLDILVNTMGFVDSVKVISNSSRSSILAKSAVNAAYKSKYLPAKVRGELVSYWLRRSYKFSNNR